MAQAAIALGSNLGEKQRHLADAVARLATLGTLVALSDFAETEPVGYLNQPRFLNGAAILETELPPLDLLHGLLAIEQAMGRDRSHGIAKGPRLIDLDLLLYEDVVMNTDELTLPHPELSKRHFVLEPLAEIAPAWIDPVSGMTIEQLLKQLG